MVVSSLLGSQRRGLWIVDITTVSDIKKWIFIDPLKSINLARQLQLHNLEYILSNAMILNPHNILTVKWLVESEVNSFVSLIFIGCLAALSFVSVCNGASNWLNILKALFTISQITTRSSDFPLMVLFDLGFESPD